MFKLSSLFFCLLLIIASECQKLGEDGYLHINNRRKLKLYEPEIDVQNYKYPEEAPAGLIQTWDFSSYPWIKMKFTCSRITIPQNPPCENYYLEINDGSNTKKYCGEINNLIVFSTADKLGITLKTGKSYGGGKMNCQIVGFNPEITTLAPPTTTKSYLERESKEIDSSEHGVTRGEKGTTCRCGWANRTPARIIGGKVTKPNEFPFMAALVSKEVGVPFCGATIISPYHAITAAHCTIKLLEYKVDGAIYVGEHDYMKDSKVVDIYNVIRIIQHEDYDTSSNVNDISLVVVDREIKFNQFVGRICLPTKRLTLDHQYVKMLGWGRTALTEPSSTVLREVNVRIVPINDCLDVWDMFIPRSNPKQICTYARQKTSCKGDSGGPVIWLDPETNRYTLVGLTSFGLQCSVNIPSVKTEVAAYLDWIHARVRASTPSYGQSQTCNKEEL